MIIRMGPIKRKLAGVTGYLGTLEDRQDELSSSQMDKVGFTRYMSKWILRFRMLDRLNLSAY